MKHFLQNRLRTGSVLGFFLLLSLVIACSSDGGDSGTSVAVTALTITQENSRLKFTYTTSGDVNTVKLYVIYSGNTDGQFFYETIENPFYIDIESLGISPGNLASFKLSATDSDGGESGQFGPVNITIADYCIGPDDLVMESGYASWTAPFGSPNAYYQVQYGSQGFTLGGGTTLTTTGTNTHELSFAQDQVYDVYVRGYCSSSAQFSDWVGPVTYYSEYNQNICTPPTNLGYSVEYNFFGDAVGANITWNDPGNNGDYEFNIVGNNQSPTSNATDTGTFNTITYLLTQNTDYDFYVRTRCLDGSYTGWVGPLNVNIGN